jgi:hypothetical protein
MSPEQAFFVKSRAVNALSLPITTETADNRICYRDELPSSDCTPDPIELVTDTIVDYATTAKPTTFQCYKLLKAQWPYMTYWLNLLFPNLEDMESMSMQGLDSIKSVLYLWILNFGPGEMDTWTDIKAAINGPGENWKNYIAWVDTNPGFSVDGGVNFKQFPDVLLAWLQSSYSSTEDNEELTDTFNYVSTVCDTTPCSSELKGYCSQAFSWSDCAKS